MSKTLYKEYRHLISSGRKLYNGETVIYYREDERHRFHVSAAKKLGNAVKRNYEKRITRHVLRELAFKPFRRDSEHLQSYYGRSHQFLISVGVKLIRVYQAFVSRRPPVCRYVPTCSEYAVEALQIHGAFRGSLMAVLRILRCHPFSRHGYDPVPPKI
jgi:uncharacterized protein